MTDFSGSWNSYYRYPSTGRDDDFWGQHILRATQDDRYLKFETDTDSSSHVVIELELSVDGSAAAGVWAEDTDPDGYYKGRKYEGTIEFKVVKGGERMNGIWHGAGKDGTMHTDIWELAKVKKPKSVTELPKRYRATYWYPSNSSIGDEPSSYDMEAYWSGTTLVLESVPNSEQSYMLMRLKIDGDIATGNWYESTSPMGEFKGAQYSGAGQLITSPKTKHMEGLWTGAGYDHEMKRMRIYTGKWEIVPLPEV